MMNDDEAQQKPRAGVTGKGFVKGFDPKRNLKGRPRSFDQLRSLALQIAAENVLDARGNTITRAEQLLRSWAKSRVPALQLAFAAYCWGKPPEKIAVEQRLKPRYQLVLHYAHDREAVEAEELRLKQLSATGDGNSEPP